MGSTPTGHSVTFQQRTVGGTGKFREARRGAHWESHLSLSDPASLALAQQMIGRSYIHAVVAALRQMGQSFDPGVLQAAIRALGARGVNLDTFLSKEGEWLEKERLARRAEVVQVLGDAPSPKT